MNTCARFFSYKTLTSMIMRNHFWPIHNCEPGSCLPSVVAAYFQLRCVLMRHDTNYTEERKSIKDQIFSLRQSEHFELNVYPCRSSESVVSISILFLALNKFKCKPRSFGIPSFFISDVRLNCNERFFRPEPV